VPFVFFVAIPPSPLTPPQKATGRPQQKPATERPITNYQLPITNYQ
jgi:hypothetical protein